MKKVTNALVIALMLFLSSIFIIDVSLADDRPVISVEDIDIRMGENGYGCVNIYNAADIGSVECCISWNPSIVTLVSANDYDTDFDAVYYRIDEVVGLIDLCAYSEESLSGEELEVISLTFKPFIYAEESEDTDLLFTAGNLFDATPQGNSISHSFDDGVATIVGESKQENLFKVDDIELTTDGEDSCYISLLNAVDVGSLELSFSWTPEILKIVSVDKSVSDFSVEYILDEENGRLDLIAYSKECLNKDLKVIAVNFECIDCVINGDCCDLTISDCGLYDCSYVGQSIPFLIQNGTASIIGTKTFSLSFSSFSIIPVISIENINVPYDGTGSGCIFLTDAVDVGSLSLRLSWDPSIVSLVDVDDSSSGFDRVFYHIESKTGILNLSAYSLDNVSGSLKIACLDFERVGSNSGGKTFDLEFLSTALYDSTPEGVPIDHTKLDGDLEIDEKPPSPGPSNGGSNNAESKENKDPTALFTVSDETAYIDEAITFDASDSYDPDDDPLTYVWDFGDGINSNEKVVSHSYNSADSYTVELTVDDGKGGKDTLSKAISIKIPNTRPTTPIISGPSSGNKKTEYSYELVSTDSDNDTIKYIIEWGDGNKENTSFNKQGESIPISHTWNDPGKYTIKVTANDGKTNSKSKEHSVFIDVKIIDGFGYLIDEDSDSVYDCCFIRALEKTVDVEFSEKDNCYLIDENNDGEIDYSYDLVTGEITDMGSVSEETKDAGISIQMIALLGGIILVGIILVAYFSKKNNKNTRR